MELCVLADPWIKSVRDNTDFRFEFRILLCILAAYGFSSSDDGLGLSKDRAFNACILSFAQSRWVSHPRFL